VGKHKKECLNCGKEITGWALSCECQSFLRANYINSFKTQDLPGMWKYIDWLPCNRPLNTTSGPVTYKSSGFAKELGLKNLFISFNGYWPEKNALNMTCSFKDLEASPTVSFAMDHGINSLLIASAGNTARAFAHVANNTDFKVYLVVPEPYLYRLWTPEEQSKNVHLIAVKGDYLDAINIGGRITTEQEIPQEGGAKNIARRDGMGTVMLDAANSIGRIPDHYFQAIGSGTGGIACWEMAKRLECCEWDNNLRLHLSQNLPFVPIFNAWLAGRNKIIDDDMPNAKESIAQLYSTVLSNRNPPYSIQGGVYDALKDTNGKMYAISNDKAKEAKKLFESKEEIDTLKAADIAVASLIQAVENDQIPKNDIVLLNITGGGLIRLKEDKDLFQITPNIVIEEYDELKNYNYL
jgi:cysteate synthase